MPDLSMTGRTRERSKGGRGTRHTLRPCREEADLDLHSPCFVPGQALKTSLFIDTRQVIDQSPDKKGPALPPLPPTKEKTPSSSIGEEVLVGRTNREIPALVSGRLFRRRRRSRVGIVISRRRCRFRLKAIGRFHRRVIDVDGATGQQGEGTTKDYQGSEDIFFHSMVG